MSNNELIKYEGFLIKRVGNVINITNKLLAFAEKSIKQVNIGNQVWMVENLNVSNFRNGDPIPEAKTDEEWGEAGKTHHPAWCYYENALANGVIYGKLYNWYAVDDPRGLAPVGWHIPSEIEWDKLTNYLGGKDVAGAKIKSENWWVENGNGTNESGFSGLPGGCRYTNGEFHNVGYRGTWLSSMDNGPLYAWNRNLIYSTSNFNRDDYNKTSGFSVRCLRD